MAIGAPDYTTLTSSLDSAIKLTHHRGDYYVFTYLPNSIKDVYLKIGQLKFHSNGTNTATLTINITPCDNFNDYGAQTCSWTTTSTLEVDAGIETKFKKISCSFNNGAGDYIDIKYGLKDTAKEKITTSHSVLIDGDISTYIKHNYDENFSVIETFTLDKEVSNNSELVIFFELFGNGNIILQGSNNNVNWVDIGTEGPLSGIYALHYPNPSYKYYRIKLYLEPAQNPFILIYEYFLWERTY